jgi:DNA repair protein REV1
MAPSPEGYATVAGVSVESTSLHKGKQVMAQDLELPSFSQVDPDVYDALPEDVKRELDAEFKRRSALESSVAIPSSPDSSKKDLAVNRITRQLAPRTTRSSLSPNKSKLYQPIASNAPALRVSEYELHSLDLDPDVFFLLPEEVQREQLVRARMLKEGTGDLLDMQTQKKTLKPRKAPSLPAEHRRHLSPPRAEFRDPLILRQHSKKGERFHLTEPSEIQNAIGDWVERYRYWAPKEKDVKFFAKYLIQCVDGTTMGDDGVEKVTAVMKWWTILLKRYWSDYESGVTRVDHVGEAWWQAFNGVKEQLDLEVRRKFGGSISLK